MILQTREPRLQGSDSNKDQPEACNGGSKLFKTRTACQPQQCADKNQRQQRLTQVQFETYDGHQPARHGSTNVGAKDDAKGFRK